MASIQTDNTYKYRWSELISKNQIGTYFLYMWLKNQSFLPSKSAYFYNWISSRKMWFKNKLDFVVEEKWLFTLPKNWLGNWIWEGSAAMPALVVSEKKVIYDVYSLLTNRSMANHLLNIISTSEFDETGKVCSIWTN